MEKPSSKDSIKKPENINPETEIRDKELEDKLRDPYYLPTREEIVTYFFANGRNDVALERNVRASLGDFTDSHFILEILNKEYIDVLADYLLSRFEDLGIKPEDVILEVGAGQGRLSYFLSEKIKQLGLPLKIIGVDSKIDEINPTFPVEEMDYKKAIRKYHPKIVISSWMPKGKDWTKQFRGNASVKEYILIGNPDLTGGIETWGYEEEEEGDSPQFEKDGFERIELEDLSGLQISTTDPIFMNRRSSSRTVSFRRR